MGLSVGARRTLTEAFGVDGTGALVLLIDRRVSWSSRHPSSKSLIVALKRKTPSMDPCGHPPVTFLGLDSMVPTLTDISLSVRKVAISSKTGVDAPFLARALRQCWKLILLKALE